MIKTIFGLFTIQIQHIIDKSIEILYFIRPYSYTTTLFFIGLGTFILACNDNNLFEFHLCF